MIWQICARLQYQQGSCLSWMDQKTTQQKAKERTLICETDMPMEFPNSIPISWSL